jgi:hypothetical protein
MCTDKPRLTQMHIHAQTKRTEEDEKEVEEEPMEKRPVGRGDDVRMLAPLPPPPTAPPPAPPVAGPDADEEEDGGAAIGGGGARRRSSSWRTGRKEVEAGLAGCCVNSSVGPGSCLRTSALDGWPHPGLCASWRRRTERGA